MKNKSASIDYFFEIENEERREREQIKANVIKRYEANCSDEVFQVGSPEVQDPYSGEAIYIPVEKDEADTDLGYVEESESVLSIDDEAERLKQEEDARVAEEIYQRLMAEAKADEMAKQSEIEALLREQEANNPSAEDYNETTGSYSGAYGKKPMNDEEAAALASIMNTNSSFSKSIEDLIQENQDEQ